jgi:hypothetical protein
LVGSAVGDEEATPNEVEVADGLRCVVEVVDARCDEAGVVGVLRDEVEVVVSCRRRLVMSVVDIIIKDSLGAGYTGKEGMDDAAPMSQPLRQDAQSFFKWYSRISEKKAYRTNVVCVKDSSRCSRSHEDPRSTESLRHNIAMQGGAG